MTAHKQQTLVFRTRVSLLFAGLVAAAIIIKLFCEQVPLRPARLALAQEILPGLAPEDGEPGGIFSLDGVPLAWSVVRNSICANPTSYSSDAQREYVAENLARLTGVEYHRIYPRLCMKESKFCYVARQVPPEVEEQVMAMRLPGVFVVPEYTRLYPESAAAANAIGYRGVDNVGLTGIERIWGFCLDGLPSTRRDDFDHQGRTILGPSPRFSPAVPGWRVVLTIRMPLQRCVEAAMDELWEAHQPMAATCTVLDPRTGDILALSARPTFDPNDPSSARPEDFVCRQACDVYAPGSTFKTPMVGAALDAGAITPNTTVYCPGTTVIGDRPLRCWGDWASKGHGSLQPMGVIARSCNPGAARIALMLGKDRAYEYLERMHIRETLDSGLDNERSGFLLPKSRQYERGVANIGFGQGVDVTDLHLLAIYGAIANGGTFYYPNIVKEVRSANGDLIRRREPCEGGRVFKKETTELLLRYLEEAVANGTGRPASVPGVRVGGKTGTSQIFDPETRAFLEGAYVMSFIAVAPVEAPRFVVLVRVDRPTSGEHGSDTAAPTARRIIKDAMRLSEELEV